MSYTTPETLLRGIKANDNTAWSNFYLVYTPLIKYCGRQKNLPEDKLDDLVQKVVMRIFTMQDHFTYDPSKGKFRSYLGKVIISAIMDIYREEKGLPENYVVEEETNDLEKLIEQEWEEYAMKEALLVLRQRVSEDTYQAFEMMTMMEKTPQETAEFLQMELKNVYDAKARCKKILQEIVAKLNE